MFDGIVPLLSTSRKRFNGALRLVLLLVLAALATFAPEQAQAQQPDPTKPSKEYIYLGGRLIATEEGSAGITPQSVGPTISSVSPNSSLPGETFTLTVTGTKLFSGSTISFSPSGIVNVGIATSSQQNTVLTAQVTIPNSAPQGAYLVVVDNGQGTASAPFTISETQPGGQFTIGFAPGSATTAQAAPPQAAHVILNWISGAQFNGSSSVWINGSQYLSHSQLCPTCQTA